MENMLKTLEGMRLPEELQEELAAIKLDAQKDHDSYWGCFGIPCYKCPSLLHGERPMARYGMLNCVHAQRFDLMNRALVLGMKVAQWHTRMFDEAIDRTVKRLLYSAPLPDLPVGFTTTPGEKEPHPDAMDHLACRQGSAVLRHRPGALRGPNGKGA